MNGEGNGSDPMAVPTIAIGYNFDEQCVVGLKWGPEFKNPDFILGVLQQAARLMEARIRVAQAQAMQVQAQQQAEAQAIRRTLRGGL